MDTWKFGSKDVHSYESLLEGRQVKCSHVARQPLQGRVKRDKKALEVGKSRDGIGVYRYSSTNAFEKEQ